VLSGAFLLRNADNTKNAQFPSTRIARRAFPDTFSVFFQENRLFCPIIPVI